MRFNVRSYHSARLVLRVHILVYELFKHANQNVIEIASNENLLLLLQLLPSLCDELRPAHYILRPRDATVCVLTALANCRKFTRLRVSRRQVLYECHFHFVVCSATLVVPFLRKTLEAMRDSGHAFTSEPEFIALLFLVQTTTYSVSHLTQWQINLFLDQVRSSI